MHAFLSPAPFPAVTSSSAGNLPQLRYFSSFAPDFSRLESYDTPYSVVLTGSAPYLVDLVLTYLLLEDFHIQVLSAFPIIISSSSDPLFKIIANVK